ncbi:hypothetical protein SFRURICE_019567 [Spodoptera frugiperda]|nr:hypothetical protein SFRURICE_019567 [Spodoptera frugiperda]
MDVRCSLFKLLLFQMLVAWCAAKHVTIDLTRDAGDADERDVQDSIRNLLHTDIAAACRRLGALDSPAAHQSCALTNWYHGGLSASLRTKAAHKAVLLRRLAGVAARESCALLFLSTAVTQQFNNCNTARRFLCVKKHPRVRDVGGFPRRNLQREKIAVSSSPTVEDLKSHSGLCG